MIEEFPWEISNFIYVVKRNHVQLFSMILVGKYIWKNLVLNLFLIDDSSGLHILTMYHSNCQCCQNLATVADLVSMPAGSTARILQKCQSMSLFWLAGLPESSHSIRLCLSWYCHQNLKTVFRPCLILVGSAARISGNSVLVTRLLRTRWALCGSGVNGRAMPTPLLLGNVAVFPSNKFQFSSRACVLRRFSH